MPTPPPTASAIAARAGAATTHTSSAGHGAPGRTSQARIAQAFAGCQSRGEAALVAYLMAGDPDLARSRPYMEAALRHADVLEIGLPFSDPIADGPTIQKADVRALAAGTKVNDVLALVRDLRARTEKPLVLMTYANPIFHMGYQTFAARARDAGLDGVILPDVPLEESADVGAALGAAGLDLIQLASPATSPERMRRIAGETHGFLYLVSLYGVTGAREGVAVTVRPLVERAKAAAGTTPVAVGFGISNPDQVRQMVEAGADGVVVGSSLVAYVEAGRSPEDLARFVSDLKNGTKRKG
ncbi:MAG: tryptophan synthase subunit alpha [Thermoplasmatota archaeon]